MHSYQKRKRHCSSQRSTRSRCQSPPSCFWPLTFQQLHCIRMKRSSWSSHRFLCSTFWPSSMATQRRCTRLHMQNQTNDDVLKSVNVPRKVVLLMGLVFSIKHAEYYNLSCRSTKPTRRIFSKGFSWPNSLHTSFSASKDSPRTTSLWRRTRQSSISPSRMCCSRTLRTNMGTKMGAFDGDVCGIHLFHWTGMSTFGSTWQKKPKWQRRTPLMTSLLI